MVAQLDAETPRDLWTYSSPNDTALKRSVIRLIERLTGQPHLLKMYEDYRTHPVDGETFWQAAMRKLELQLNFDPDGLAGIPREGTLVIIANHPFGILDGLVLSYLTSTVRPRFKVLTNSVLMRAPEVRPFLIPIDFDNTREATANNVRARAETIGELKAGGCIVVFPAGGVATVPKPFASLALDARWQPFTAKIIRQSEATVVPVYFPGQNSRLFQIASHISLTLRLSLLFKEVHDRIGTQVKVHLGAPIAFSEIAHLSDRHALMQHLRDRTYGLA